MSLTDGHRRWDGCLNQDIFAAVIDEIIGWLNMYERYDMVQFLDVLRLVCQNANIRLRPIALRYIIVVSSKQLAHLLMLGVPNALSLRSVTFRTYAPPAMIKAFFCYPRQFTALQRVIFNHHANPSTAPDGDWTGASLCIPQTVTELSLITTIGSFPERSQYLYQIAKAPMAPVTRLALFGLRIPLLHMPDLKVLVLSLRPTDERELYEESSRNFNMSLRCLRLVFIPGHNTSPLTAAERRELLSRITKRIIIEELQPVGDDIATWFADKVEDGTIWTMPAVNLRELH